MPSRARPQPSDHDPHRASQPLPGHAAPRPVQTPGHRPTLAPAPQAVAANLARTAWNMPIPKAICYKPSPGQSHAGGHAHDSRDSTAHGAEHRLKASAPRWPGSRGPGTFRSWERSHRKTRSSLAWALPHLPRSGTGGGVAATLRASSEPYCCSKATRNFVAITDARQR